MSRVLALDHGAARCGVALSDPSRTLATPLCVVERPDSRRGMARIAGLVREHAVGTVVVGLPLGLSGRDTDQTRAARAFASELTAKLRGVEVDLFDERFTTAIAARQDVARSADVGEDARAAAVLLDDWLTARRAEAPA